MCGTRRERLRRSPAFSVVVVLTLTLGIGANTAIFSAVNAIMLRALPAERPEELVSLTALYPNGAEPFSYAAYRRIAVDGTHLVDAMAASTARRDAAAIDGPPEAVDVKWVSGNYFTTLGVLTAVGRPLLISDDPQPPGLAVAVISDTFWARRFGRDPAVVGRSVRLRGAAFAIVGVARRGFASETPGESVDLWMPIAAQPNTPAWVWTGHSTTWLSVLARRRPGVSLAQARAGLEPVYERIRDEVAAGTDSVEFRRSVLESRLEVSEASGGISRLRDNLAAPLMILMGIVGLVLLVACANVATLMLTRAIGRRREMAMSLALGASRLRLVRQGMIEALLLTTIGGVGGFLLAIWGTSALSSLLSGVLPVVLDISPDAARPGVRRSDLVHHRCAVRPSAHAVRHQGRPVWRPEEWRRCRPRRIPHPLWAHAGRDPDRGVDRAAGGRRIVRAHDGRLKDVDLGFRPESGRPLPRDSAG